MFYRLDARTKGTSGVMDLTAGTSSILLQYNSPSRNLDLSISLHPRRSGPIDGTASYVDVSVGVHGDSTPRNPLPLPKCTLPRVFTLLRSASGLAKADPQYTVGVGLVLVGKSAYWNVGYVTGTTPSKSVEDLVNASTCSMEHPK